MTDETLITLLGGRQIGTVNRDRHNRLSYVYNDDWRSFRGAFPLSLSMPLAGAQHKHAPIEAFLWGLLPLRVGLTHPIIDRLAAALTTRAEHCLRTIQRQS